MNLSKQQVFVPGPLHPDLFGGETPMTISVPLREALALYRVEIAITKTDSYEVVAASAAQAIAIVTRWAEQDECFDTDIEASDIRKLERSPTDDEIQDYLHGRQEFSS